MRRTKDKEFEAWLAALEGRQVRSFDLIDGLLMLILVAFLVLVCVLVAR